MKIKLKTVLLLVGVSTIVSVSSTLAHTDVVAEEAKELIDSTDDLTVIDVREPHEYNNTKGHIPGALNYPWYAGALQARCEELPMDAPVLVVCGSGGRSHRAAEFLDSKGFSIVYDMLGGMMAWRWETETSDDSEIKYSGGTGEPNDPYQIATAENLMLLGDSPEDYDKHFILTADIDLDPNLPGRKVLDKAVIDDYFTGVFDGDVYTISRLTIRGEHDVGLFSRVGYGAEIKNLELVDVSIAGSGYYVGGLVGLSNGSVSDCYISGIVSGDSGVGGLAGHNIFGSINMCHSDGTVSGNSTVGGLVGYSDGSITASYSTAAVNGAGDIGGLVGVNGLFLGSELFPIPPGEIRYCYGAGLVSGEGSVGGLVGTNEWYGSITASYSTSIVIGNDKVGGLVGYNWNNMGISSSFWDIQTSGQNESAGGTGKTTAEMQTIETFLEAGWDFVGEDENGTEEIWSICEGTNYPRFVWQIPAGDFVCPDGITMDDFSFFLEHWLDDNCDSSNNFCEGTDLDQSGTVDVNDLEIFFESWLAESP
jgi:rhodanese-related sulfurtransferase